MLRLVPRLPVKWGFDLFVDERYAIARGLSPSFLSFAPTGRKVIAQGNALGSMGPNPSKP